MALIQWKDDYSVGVLLIDTQHKRLIELINSLNDAMKQGKGKEIIGKIISEMLLYTKRHFSTEEQYFDKFNYEKSEEHKCEHNEFVKKVQNFKADYEAGKIGVSVSVMNFLSSWLREHILDSDKQYRTFMKENNIS
jgi:hemerythrin